MKRLVQTAASALLAGLLLSNCTAPPPPPPEADKAELLLMTSLPLRFGEATMQEQLQGGGEPTAAYRRLQQRFAITSLDDLEQLDGRAGAVLLLAQPRALAPIELVALDRWIRAGGRALILADPALSWPSDYSLGDARRPLFTSLLSPLLSHWGIELVMPMEADSKPIDLTLGGARIETVTPGKFVARGLEADGTAQCEITESDRIASCAVGEGRALLLADADLLQARLWQADGPLNLAGDRRANMQWVETMLAELQ